MKIKYVWPVLKVNPALCTYIPKVVIVDNVLSVNIVPIKWTFCLTG